MVSPTPRPTGGSQKPLSMESGMGLWLTLVPYHRYGTVMTADDVSNDNPAAHELNARRLLLPYLGGLVVMCVLLQIVIAATGNEIDLTAGLLTGLVAVYYAAFLVMRRQALKHIRFAPLVAHAVTFVVLNGSFQLHAAILAFVNSNELRGDEHLPIDAGWFGPTLAMAGFWAIGFTIHAVASISQRGYES